MIEDELKSGRLKGLVATSSLELGIDMGAVDLVVQVESPGAVSRGPAAHRPGRPPGRRAEPGQAVPEAPRRPRRGGGRRASACTRASSSTPATRATRSTCSPSRSWPCARSTSGRSTSWPRSCAGPPTSPSCPTTCSPRCSTCSPGRYPSDEFAELRPAHRVGPRRRHRARPRRRAATGGHQRRHHPRPRAVRRVPARRHPRRRARRGDGLREPAGRDVPARRVHLADRGHHPRAGGRHAGARASRGRCRSGTATARAGRSSSVGRSASSCATVRAAAARRGARRSCTTTTTSTSGPPPTCSQYLDEQAEATGVGARRPHDRRRAVPRRDRRLAGLRALAVRRAGARAVGHGAAGPARPSGGASTSR